MSSAALRRVAEIVCLGLACLALGGCALLPAAAPAPTYPPGIASRAELTAVPFFPQEEYQCGPAALAMVLQAAGVARTPEQLSREVYLPAKEGSLQSDMLAATRRAGLVAVILPPNLGAIVQELAAGHAVVVLQNLGFDVFPRWHYAVVVGYDLRRHELVLRSGDRQRLVVSEGGFDASWSKSGRWALLAVPARELPASVGEDGYVAAAAVLERVAPDRAREAYELVLSRWPQDLVARMGLGNLAYGARDLGKAEAQYRLAAAEHADSGDAWNNLAQVLHEQGRDGEALAAAQRAVAIGGPRLQAYRETLSAIGVAPASAP
jgi:tetratricopeptide (TPR) repeat protein